MLIHRHIIQASNETMWGGCTTGSEMLLFGSTEQKENLGACLLNLEQILQLIQWETGCAGTLYVAIDS